MDAASGFETCALRVRGLVQGVGFRPFVWTLAKRFALAGSVRNDGEGVLIELAGPHGAIAALQAALLAEAPPLARIEGMERLDWLPDVYPDGFTIETSHKGRVATGIVPDAATCPACLAEVLDPANRRFGYAFTNCTHCGPRLSIIEQVPYDRATTAMAPFTMCPACQSEYDDPADRRFHAQPNACPDCGPKLWFESRARSRHEADPLALAIALLKDGGVLALKGLGGFHLACDAASDDAVTTLRTRKRRYAKPLAIMLADMNAVRALCHADGAEEAALTSAAAPIVLLRPRLKRSGVAPSVALEQDRLGVMLPYTPLHHGLLRAFGGPLVMTSGNLSDEPQAIDNDDARERLSPLVDGFVMHDRAIVNRVDDSVGRVERGAFRLIRRARGFAPAPIAYPQGFDRERRVLGMGGELKNTFALTTPEGVVLSPHLGDLDHTEAARAARATRSLYERLFEERATHIAVDRHADYWPTQVGRSEARERGLEVLTVDHHHAHIAAVLGDNGHPREGGAVIGLALDGLGLGPDGNLWGGEVLLADYRTATRLGGLPAVPMPGGNTASREPWRNLVAHLWAAGLNPLEAGFDPKASGLLVQMMTRGLNSPPASSAGRLFDAVAALLGLHAERVAFEGQAAMALEACAARSDRVEEGYPIRLVHHGEVSSADAPLRAFWRKVLDDRERGVPAPVMAMRFHQGLANALCAAASRHACEHGVRTVALSGGVFLNALLCRLVTQQLEANGLTVLTHCQVPSNDGGLSLGQALIALARLDAEHALKD